MDDALTEELKEQLKDGFRSFDEYHSVCVLLLWWEDGDSPGFKLEAEALQELFLKSFYFFTETYSIPSEKAQLSLDQRINNLILQHSSDGSLLIIHYGGHGDEDDDRTSNRERQSVWAA